MGLFDTRYRAKCVVQAGDQVPYEVIEEYRDDALGRRVLVRTRSEHACTQYCLNTLRRTVWDGDQVLYEISAPGHSGATPAQMEADTGLAVPFFQNTQHTSVAGFFPYGRVMYEHGGGIDAPLGVVRMDYNYSSEFRDPQVIVPHANWRGSYDRGTPIIGSCILFSSNGTQLAPAPDSTPSSGDQYGGVVGGGTYGGTKEHCLEVDWPASYTWSALQYRRGYAGPSAWMGSLIFESRDASASVLSHELLEQVAKDQLQFQDSTVGVKVDTSRTVPGLVYFRGLYHPPGTVHVMYTALAAEHDGTPRGSHSC